MNYRIEDYKYLLFKKIWLTIWGKIRNNLIRVFYVKWSNNFGDILNVDILKYFGFTPVFAYPSKAEVICIGTILGIVKYRFSGYVLGSGIDYMCCDSIVDSTKILGVRGPLTSSSLQCSRKVTIGDPGLLVSKIYPNTYKVRYLLGVIPHESEKRDERLVKFARRFPDKVVIISPNNKSPKRVIKNICACKFIVSSSLHGLIVSDSYGIPSARIKLNELDENGDFKFKDYYLSFGRSLNTHNFSGDESIEELISKCVSPDMKVISEIQHKLCQMFIEYKLNCYGK